MIDPSRTRDRALDASGGRLTDELDELYRLTKAAQARAEWEGFAGIAAALADIADLLTLEGDVDAALAGGPTGRGPAGGRVTRH